MRKFCAAFIVLSALLGSTTAFAGDGYSYSYSSNGWNSNYSYSGPESSGRWEYVPGGVDAKGFRTEPKLVQRVDPYSSGANVRINESSHRDGYSRSYTRSDSNGTYYRYESSGRHSSYYSERYTPRR
jgi:hypothetical protein